MGVRFAPSPTGAFHLGNFRTAWISHQWARALGKPWCVRFEDIDQPRVVPRAQQNQLEEMSRLGMIPDELTLQTANRKRHWELFEKARREGVIYPCSCSRKEVLASLASAPHGPDAVYSGHCRRRPAGEAKESLAWRFKNDDLSGTQDFIVARTDGEGGEASFVPAYHWACAIDDWDGRYDLLVRAFDLETAATVQRRIQAWLAQETPGVFPAVFHTSLVTADDGHRLEKRTKGVTLPEWLARHSVDELKNIFEKSFVLKASDFKPSRIWGEDRPQIRLCDLGINL